MEKPTDRRAFFKDCLVTVAAVSVGQLGVNRIAYAAELPHVDESSPQATGLGYKHDAALVDKTKFAKFQEGQTCRTCQLYSGAADAEWGPCALFPGHSVNAKGWCSAYVKKAG